MTDWLLETYRHNKLKIWSVILIGVPCILIIGSILAPQIFWKNFIWRYFWGPVVADASGGPVDGISEGYNIINTLVYGTALVLAFLGIWELVDHYDVEIDARFVFSLFPWILLGGSLRALEDVDFFTRQTAPFFISPVIYFMIGISAVAVMLFGVKLKSIDIEGDKHGITRIACLSLPLIILFLFRPWLYLFFLFPLLGCLLFFYMIGMRQDWMDESYLLSSYGVSALIVSLGYNILIIATREGAHPWEVVLIPVLAAAVTLLFTVVLKGIDILSEGKGDISPIFLTPLNAAIIYSHLFDASATFRGIRSYGYVEKHVLPTAAIRLTGTSLVMFPLKLILIVMVIYVLDVLYEKELSDSLGMKRLLKLVVIILGLAPAVRNTLRLAMGV